jgi:hypothetical protein
MQGGKEVIALPLTDLQLYERQQAEGEAVLKRIQEELRTQELLEKAGPLVGKRGGQCLIFARKFTGIWIHGYAGNVKITDTEPEVGGIFKTRGHVGVVLEDRGDTLLIVDSNSRYDERVRIREIKKTSVLGYING